MTPLFASAHEALLNRRAALARMGARLSESDRVELQEIEQALTRIAAGSYGSCELCGRAIGRQRLRAVPEARRCLDCE